MANAALEMAQGDTLPIFAAVCKMDGVAFDLTGATCRLHLNKGSVSILDVIMDIPSPLTGAVEYDWLTTLDETEDFLGDYEVEVEADYGNGKVLTFPNTKKKPIITFNRQLA